MVRHDKKCFLIEASSSLLAAFEPGTPLLESQIRSVYSFAPFHTFLTQSSTSDKSSSGFSMA